MLRIPNMSCELWWISDSRSGGHEPGAKGESGVQVVVRVVLKVTAKEGEKDVGEVLVVCHISEFC